LQKVREKREGDECILTYVFVYMCIYEKCVQRTNTSACTHIHLYTRMHMQPTRESATARDKERQRKREGVRERCGERKREACSFFFSGSLSVSLSPSLPRALDCALSLPLPRSLSLSCIRAFALFRSLPFLALPPFSYLQGILFVVDFKGFSFSLLRRMKRSDVQRGVLMLQDSFPLRYRNYLKHTHTHNTHAHTPLSKTDFS